MPTSELLGEYTFLQGTEVYVQEATTPRHFPAHSALVQGSSSGMWLYALTNVGLAVHTVQGRAWKAVTGLTGVCATDVFYSPRDRPNHYLPS